MDRIWRFDAASGREKERVQYRYRLPGTRVMTLTLHLACSTLKAVLQAARAAFVPEQMDRPGMGSIPQWDVTVMIRAAINKVKKIY